MQIDQIDQQHMSRPDLPDDQGDTPPARVTAPLSAAERQRRRRARAAQANSLLYASDDWQMFLDKHTLPQKAGCRLEDLIDVVAKELVDNALDIGSGEDVTFTATQDGWRISDLGPGIDPAMVPTIFAVNRPLLSSKRRRLPLRGMLGNGLRVVMGAIYCFGADFIVTTRGRRMSLAVDPSTGKTTIVSDQPTKHEPGTIIETSLGQDRPVPSLAEDALAYAKTGKTYAGGSSPHWYSQQDFHRLLSTVIPEDATVQDVLADLSIPCRDQRTARTISAETAAALLHRIQQEHKPVPPAALGSLVTAVEADDLGYCHARMEGTATIVGANIPFVVEALVTAERTERRGQAATEFHLVVNRSPALADLWDAGSGNTIVPSGCGLHRTPFEAKSASYTIIISVIAPRLLLTTDGKEPDLGPLSSAVREAARKACAAAHRRLEAPARGTTLKDAAFRVLPTAYMKASADNTLPANARQIMYAARPDILRITGKDRLDDKYFTQTLLPDFIEAHPDLCADWDVVFDARGNLTEPHTGATIPLGTIAVRDYVDSRRGAAPPPPVDLEFGAIQPYDTRGPLNRYRTVLFIEKEGFGPLLQHARVAERFDCAIMSTKGMSVTAARHLLDELHGDVERVIVLHDFDISGFSIVGTLAASNRRYEFRNPVEVIDAGLRLTDVIDMALDAEPTDVSLDFNRIETLKRHGATAAEIAFLAKRRVELNAMTADAFLAFVERKLLIYGAGKVIPDDHVLQHHAREVRRLVLADRLLRDHADAIDAILDSQEDDPDLHQRVRDALMLNPSDSWDRALARIVAEDQERQT